MALNNKNNDQDIFDKHINNFINSICEEASHFVNSDVNSSDQPFQKETNGEAVSSSNKDHSQADNSQGNQDRQKKGDNIISLWSGVFKSNGFDDLQESLDNLFGKPQIQSHKKESRHTGGSKVKQSQEDTIQKAWEKMYHDNNKGSQSVNDHNGSDVKDKDYGETSTFFSVDGETDAGQKFHVDVREDFNDGVDMIFYTEGTEDNPLVVNDDWDGILGDDLLSEKGNVVKYIKDLIDNDTALQAILFNNVDEFTVDRNDKVTTIHAEKVENVISAVRSATKYITSDNYIVTFPTELSYDVSVAILNDDGGENLVKLPSHIVNSGEFSFINC